MNMYGKSDSIGTVTYIYNPVSHCLINSGKPSYNHFKQEYIMKYIILILSIVAMQNTYAEITFTQYYEGIPDYKNKQTFGQLNNGDIKRLFSTARNIKTDKTCIHDKIVVMNTWKIDRTTNICNKQQFDVMLGLIATKVKLPKIKDRLSIYAANNSKNILLTYMDIVDGGFLKIPYLSIWSINQSEKGTHIQFGGTYLNGEYFGSNFFGEHTDRPTTFLMYHNCIECESIEYIAAIDFSDKSRKYEADIYKFNYSLKGKDYQYDIEYYLPGMGHTVSADTWTKILPASKTGPHILQKFYLVDDKKIEWWIFTCKKYKCDNQFYTNKLPKKYQKLWNKPKQTWIEQGRSRAY